MPRSRVLAIALAVALGAAACGGSEADTATAADTAAADSATATTMADDDMADDDMADDEMSMAAWQTLELVDVDGESFTLGDYASSTVFVENFATWCPNCRTQLATTNEAAGQLDDVEFLALSVETDLSAADVAAYAEENGFDNIRFAVMTPEFLAAMVDAFGNSAVNPPSTPHFFVDPMGHAGELVTGFESVDEITASLPAA